MGKGKIAHNEQFLLFHSVSTRLENCLPFSSNLKLLFANSFNLEESEIGQYGKATKQGQVIIKVFLTHLCPFLDVIFFIENLATRAMDWHPHRMFLYLSVTDTSLCCWYGEIKCCADCLSSIF